jgi:hypothetical protein
VVFHPASPGAFAPSISLGFILFEPGLARLTDDDAQGKLVRRLLDGPFAAGCLDVEWKGRDDVGRSVSGGVYLIRLEAEFVSHRATASKRVVLVGSTRSRPPRQL